MYDILLVALGVVMGLGLLAMVFYLAPTPRRLGRKGWLASASGERDGPTKHPSDPSTSP